MFIEQAFKPENKFWKYLVGSLIVIIATFIGQLPMLVAFAVKHMQTGKPMPTQDSQLYTYLEDLNLTTFFLLLSFAVAMLGLYIAMRNIHGQKFREVITSRKKVDWKRFKISFLIWGVFSAVSVLATHLMDPDVYVLQFDLPKFIGLAVIGIVFIPIQTSLEELLFRGYLMQGFGLLARNRWVPLVLTSVIFGGMHLFNPEVEKMGYVVSLYYIGTGLFLGIMTLMDEGTELALGFHAANNLVAALLVTADWTAFQTNSVFKDVSEPSAGWDILLPLLVIYPILLFIFSKIYKWSGWKEKLAGTLDYTQSALNETRHSHD